MKKLITYLLLIILLSGVLLSSTSSAFAEHNPEYSQEMLDIAKKVLIDLGYWRDFTEDDTYLTRAEVAEIVFEIHNSDHGNFSTVYADVPENHWALYWISIARVPVERYGNKRFYTMSGDGNAFFRPDDFITYQEFAKVLVTHLCWGSYIMFNDNEYPQNYPDGYLKLAELLGLYPLEENKYTSPLTKDDAIILLYNSLKAPATRETRSEYGFWRETYDWVRHNENVVPIRGYCKKIDENTLEIDGVKYTGQVRMENFSEGYVFGYCKIKDDFDVSEIFTCYKISSLLFDNPKNISDELPQGKFQLM